MCFCLFRTPFPTFSLQFSCTRSFLRCETNRRFIWSYKVQWPSASCRRRQRWTRWRSSCQTVLRCLSCRNSYLLRVEGLSHAREKMKSMLPLLLLIIWFADAQLRGRNGKSQSAGASSVCSDQGNSMLVNWEVSVLHACCAIVCHRKVQTLLLFEFLEILWHWGVLIIPFAPLEFWFGFFFLFFFVFFPPLSFLLLCDCRLWAGLYFQRQDI